MAAIDVAGPEAVDEIGSSLARIWGVVFAEPPYSESAEAIDDFEPVRLRRHAARAGFSIAIARDDAGDPIGFAYGMTASPGSWWEDYLAQRVDASTLGAWVPGAFEFTELAVLPAARGSGLGRRLVTRLLHRRPEPRVICQTAAEETPARALYRSLGFRDLADFEDSVLLGRDLPMDI